MKRSKYPEIGYVEGENPWLTYDKHRIYNINNCVNRVFVGETGSGKSWGLLSYCSNFPSFDIDKDWFFSASKMFKEMQKDFPPGKVWVLDEAGIDLNNLSYFDQINRGLNAFLQTGRSKNYFLGLTLPYLSLLSKPVRILMTSVFTANKWTKDNLTKIHPLELQWNDELKKFYKKRLLVKKEKDNNIFCNEIRLKKPTQLLIDKYEGMKKEFQINLLEEVAIKLENFDAKKKELLAPTGRNMTINQEEIKADLDAGLTLPEIAIKRGVTDRAIGRTKKSLERYGIYYDTIMEGNRTKKYERKNLTFESKGIP